MIVDEAWRDVYPNVYFQYLDTILSYLTPELVEITTCSKGVASPFRFFSHFANHPSFMDIVNEGWKSTRGSGLRTIWAKLNSIKRKLKTLHKEEFVGIHDNIIHW